MGSLRHECGVFGVVGDADAARIAYLGLHALQHRGQEGAGIVARHAGLSREVKGLGLVHEVFDETAIRSLPGDAAIGHVRYSTAGGNTLANVQPFLVRWREGQLAICHNGTLTNAGLLREELESRGAIFGRSSDTEVILHLVAASDQKTLINRLVDALGRVEGAWCVLALAGDKLVAARDPWGFRPLVLGRRSDAWIVASESCAIEFAQGTVVREVEPGEMLILDEDGLTSLRPFPRKPRRACIFEYVYFARPDTTLFGREVYPARVRMGHVLAREYPARADVVIGVPDSGTPAALGFAEASGLPYAAGLLRSHYVGRTFIEPTQRIRDFGVRLKLHPNKSVVSGKRVVVVDDSIVRGTTSQKIVRMLRQAGAVEVHVRVASPPMTGPCHYGIDTPDRADLLAHRFDLPRIRAFLDADSVAYLSIEQLREATAEDGLRTCDACFTGNYPIEPAHRGGDGQLTLFQGPARALV
ncbi:MAG: amidophosphoribosyltransferase [Deltaproteobacteria bacterium]|nr:amidophosphoribosyltransferase [Deltaproteobacteria bacterium]